MSRTNISSDLRATLRDWIVAGQIEPGSRLNEVHLSKELDVSRTPLREALCGLVNEKFVLEVPRRGFFVAPLSVEEIEQLYVIRQILDPAALRKAGLPDEATLGQLKKLNTKIAGAKRAKRIIDLDDEWHLTLVAGCNNEVLLDLIRQHMIRTRRYELAYMSQAKNVSVVTDEHVQIIDALEQRKLSLACKHLEQNMSTAVGPLIDWVRSQQQPEANE